MKPTIQSAEIVLPCATLDETLAFFTGRLGFRLETIFPADDPAVAVVSGHGLRLRLERGAGGDPGRLRLCGSGHDGPTHAPNGTRIEWDDPDPPLKLPPLRPSFTLSRGGATQHWIKGRAGMLYRDLIPDRQGGRFIASHIRIPEGGPVPDFVHFHKIRFQMIYCYKGWVRVVYEDQGAPLLLRPGDCVLQPPEIRHRVLEASPGLEVIEIGCPAEHVTSVDHSLELPTAVERPERAFGGQRFVCHQAAAAPWKPWRLDGFVHQDLGIAAATDGLAQVCVARTERPAEPAFQRHDAEFHFLFVLRGAVTLLRPGEDPVPLTPSDSLVLPAGTAHALAEGSDDLELLEVMLPT